MTWAPPQGRGPSITPPRRRTCLRDLFRPIRDDVVQDAAQQHPIATALPLHDAVARRLAAIARPERRPRDLTDPQELAPQRRSGNLVEDAVLDAMDGEDSLVRLRILRDYAIVRLDFRLLLAARTFLWLVLLLSAGWILRRHRARQQHERKHDREE